MSAEKLNSAADLARHLDALLLCDARLTAVRERAGVFEVRTTAPGFGGMARVVCGQQLSVASARAIWSRFAALPGALEPSTYLGLDETTVRATGFSGGKFRTLRAVAEAVTNGELDFDRVADQPANEAIAALTRIKGVGPWTAELYLMFCAGHPDIFPAGDLAIQKAVGHGLGLASRPGTKELRAMSEGWAPHRAAAALLFWGYFAAMRGKEGVSL